MPSIQAIRDFTLVRPAGAFEARAAEGSNRRAHERLTMSDLAWLNRVGLKYGPSVSLIDLSVGGVQIEATSRCLQPGAIAVVEIAGRHGEVAIPARVVRCEVAGLSPNIVYRGALEFKRPFALPEVDSDRTGLGGNANPLHVYARLSAALNRLGRSNGFRSPNVRLADVGAAPLAAMLALIDSPSGRRAGVPFSRELSRLFDAVTNAVEAEEPCDKMLADVAERLRRAVPALSIRLIDALAQAPFHMRKAVAFDVPSARGRGKRLLVEMPSGSRLEEWHIQLLKTAAHLATLITAIDEVRQTAEEREQASHIVQPAGQTNVEGWHRLVVRYRDGHMLKGYSRDFLPAKGQVHVDVVPNGPLTSRVAVSLTYLKAVFFVHEFDGLQPNTESAGSLDAHGRPIVVTFFDGEVLVGKTLNYSADACGFFMMPTDIKGNNHRIFVVNGAVRHVQFPNPSDVAIRSAS